jgi:hypothetical protein
MLDSHPDICGAPEFFCIPDILKVRDNLHELISFEWIDTICSYEDADRCIASLIESLLLPLADKHGRALLSEKTPRNVLVFSRLLELFPRARFIHVVRDPRAVIASLLEVGKRQKEKGKKVPSYTGNVLAAIKHVKEHLQAGFAAADASPERVLTVLYEELVTEPANETKRLCEFLKIPWSEEMLYPGKKKHLGEIAQTSGRAEGIWYNASTYNRDPERSEINKWRTQLTPVQKVMIANAFTDIRELRKFGYELTLTDVPYISRGLGVAVSMAQTILSQAVNRSRSLRRVALPVRRVLGQLGS